MILFLLLSISVMYIYKMHNDTVLLSLKLMELTDKMSALENQVKILGGELVEYQIESETNLKKNF